MRQLTNIVNYETAKLLDNLLYSIERYAAEDKVKAGLENGSGVDYYSEGEYICDYDFIEGKTYMAPTISDVLDWLFEEHNLVVSFDPMFTFALESKVAYYYTIWRVNEITAKMDKIYEEKYWAGSLQACIEQIVEKINDFSNPGNEEPTE